MVGGKDTACSSSTVASACALKVTRHTSYSCPEVAGAGVSRTSSGKSSTCPGAAGRGDALRPLVLRRNSSGGSMMPRTGAWSDAEQGSVLTPSGKARQCSQSFADLFAPCTSPSQRVHLVDSVSSCHLHRTHTTCMGT